MRIAFLNPQGNFDPHDSRWSSHPDFGGQLVYVKELALAMASLGHEVDIVTRRIIDPAWPEFAASLDGYPGHPQVRIVRIPCGPAHFLPKETLWPHLYEWARNILTFYRHHEEGEGMPQALTAHYADGGLSAALIRRQTGLAFTFTAHSLGAQKMDKLNARPENLAELNARFRFTCRIAAELVSMRHAGRIITSTRQEQREQYAHPAYRGAIDPTDERRFAVIPPGVNVRIFSPTPTDVDDVIAERIAAALARDISVGRRQLPLIVAASRLDAKKNHAGLVEAFAITPELQARMNLAIVVRGLDDPLRQYQTMEADERTLMEQIVALISTYHLWGKVTAFPLNGQRELAAAYRVLARRRSVFALTALYEPFGLAPLEAMSCGLPAVVTRNGGPAESMREGEREFAVLVNPAQPREIAEGLLRLTSETTWERFRKVGMQRIAARYTWERTAQGYLEVIKDLLAHPKACTVDVPPYFLDPRPENEMPLSDLAAIYFPEG